MSRRRSALCAGPSAFCWRPSSAARPPKIRHWFSVLRPLHFLLLFLGTRQWRVYGRFVETSLPTNHHLYSSPPVFIGPLISPPILSGGKSVLKTGKTSALFFLPPKRTATPTAAAAAATAPTAATISAMRRAFRFLLVAVFGGSTAQGSLLALITRSLATRGLTRGLPAGCSKVWISLSACCFMVHTSLFGVLRSASSVRHCRGRPFEKLRASAGSARPMNSP